MKVTWKSTKTRLETLSLYSLSNTVYRSEFDQFSDIEKWELLKTLQNYGMFEKLHLNDKVMTWSPKALQKTLKAILKTLFFV